MRTYADDYFDALEALIGRTEDARARAPSAIDDGMPPVYAMFFSDFPMTGVLSAFTLGAALGQHVEELDAHVELVVSLRTNDKRWGLALAHLAERCRAQLQILPGATLNMGEPLSRESEMSAFLVTNPHQWAEPPRLDVGTHRVVILEAHPIHRSELELVRSGDGDRVERHLVGHRYESRRPAL